MKTKRESDQNKEKVWKKKCRQIKLKRKETKKREIDIKTNLEKKSIET